MGSGWAVTHLTPVEALRVKAGSDALSLGTWWGEVEGFPWTEEGNRSERCSGWGTSEKEENPERQRQGKHPGPQNPALVQTEPPLDHA